MLIYLNIIGVILIQIIKLAVARVAIPTGAMNYVYNWVGNSIDYSYDEYNTGYESGCHLTEMPPDPTSMCCGVDTSTNNRIIGGLPTSIKQYPWLARIEYEVERFRTESSCGGSLISGLYVLTAAHCVTGTNFTETPVNVVLGDYNMYYDGRECIEENGEIVCTDGEVKIAIAKIIPHEDYFDDEDSEDVLLNDIALIKLAKMAPYTDFIRPICLPTLDLTLADHKNLWLSLTGWGLMLQLNTTKEYFEIPSDVKRHVRLPYVPNEKCKLVENYTSITKFHICAGGVAGEDACMGDSGGPLMYNNDGKYQITGIVSLGADDPCGKADVPGVYTNVSILNG